MDDDETMGLGDTSYCPAGAAIKFMKPIIRQNGMYWIDPTGTEPAEVECDMTLEAHKNFFMTAVKTTTLVMITIRLKQPVR